ncbi:decaprenyl-phosphate phosphoribosyltransferase [Anaerolineae bacterium]|nr:decaprenyl-phosphate phosphoribosyltransferase [Anaerolineaceae bacterium]GDX67597.1 decaprenyl-phosphate phosphoribosyltransferase [Anaerolineae bacterium]
MTDIAALIRALRPRQWIKNLVILVPLVFDVKLLQMQYLVPSLLAFGVFCALASSVYLINDLFDAEADRLHPTKKNRPIAAGLITPRSAVITAVMLPLLALPAAYAIKPLLGLLAAVYWVQNLLYSYRLKNIVILDVMVVATGFLLRLGAGVTLVNVERFSPWMFICVGLGALLVGFGKRRHELTLMQAQASTHRSVLQEYTLPFLDLAINMAAAAILIAYSLYTFSAPNMPANHLMMLTIAPVWYGTLRYLYLLHVAGKGGAPEDLLLEDRPLLATVFVWALAAVLVLYLA